MSGTAQWWVGKVQGLSDAFMSEILGLKVRDEHINGASPQLRNCFEQVQISYIPQTDGISLWQNGASKEHVVNCQAANTSQLHVRPYHIMVFYPPRP